MLLVNFDFTTAQLKGCGNLERQLIAYEKCIDTDQINFYLRNLQRKMDEHLVLVLSAKFLVISCSSDFSKSGRWF